MRSPLFSPRVPEPPFRCCPTSTIAKAYRVLRSILATAVDDEVILRNPCRIKGAVTEVSSERPILTPAEVARLAEVIEPRYRLVVLLAVYASLLRGELMGLRRSDIEMEAMRLTVCRSVSSGDWARVGHGAIWGLV